MRENEWSDEMVASKRAFVRRTQFVERLQGAEQHWFFIQAMECLSHGLYLPATSSFLNGIEATLRIYNHRYAGKVIEWSSEPSAYRVLSNALIVQARDLGLAVERLAFPDEADFHERLSSAKPNRSDVRLVAIRNKICHGNLWDFSEDYSGEGDRIFVPELLRELSPQLLEMSEAWAAELQRFRAERTA